MAQNDYIRALIIKKDWKTILNFVDTEPSLFLKSLHIKSVRKEIFSNFTTENYCDLLKKSIEPIQKQIYQIMLEHYDEKPDLISKTALELFNNIDKYPFVLRNIISIVALFPEEQLYNVLFVPGKGQTLYERIKSSLESKDVYSSSSKLISPREFISERDISKRKSILKIIIKEFENKAKANDPSSQAMSLLSLYSNTWSTDAELREEIKKAVNESMNSYVHPSAYILFTNGNVPSFSNFDFQLFYSKKLFTKLDYYNYAIKILENDAKQETLKQTNLKRLIKNIALTSRGPIQTNLIQTVKSLSIADENSKERTIFSRIEKEYQQIAFHQFSKRGSIDMISFLADQFTSEFNKIPLLNILFNADKSLDILHNIIQETISNRNVFINIHPDVYTDRLISLLNTVSGVLKFMDDDFSDQFLVEVIRHPTISNRVNYYFESNPIAGISCILNIHNLKTIGSLYNKKDLDEFGFCGKRTIKFPPLDSSLTKKAQPYECKNIHPFELALISSQLLGHQNETLARSARKCYESFVTKVLTDVIENPQLASRANEVHFRFCRYCMRDDPEIVSTNLITPLSINAAILANSDSIEKLIEYIPDSCASTVLPNAIEAINR